MVTGYVDNWLGCSIAGISRREHWSRAFVVHVVVLADLRKWKDIDLDGAKPTTAVPSVQFGCDGLKVWCHLGLRTRLLEEPDSMHKTGVQAELPQAFPCVLFSSPVPRSIETRAGSFKEYILTPDKNPAHMSWSDRTTNVNPPSILSSVPHTRSHVI